MSASNHTWVCFDCRFARRHPKKASTTPRCDRCGAECFCLGYKVEIPRKDDVRGWRKLRDDCRQRELNAIAFDAAERTRVVQEAERQIAELQAKGENSERSRLIANIRKTLAAG